MSSRKLQRTGSEPNEGTGSQLTPFQDATSNMLRNEILEKYENAIRQLQAQITTTTMDVLRRQLACGCMLLDVSAMVPHGGWKKWLRDHFEASTGLSERSAQRYMKSALAFRKMLVARGYVSEEDATEQPQLRLEYVEEFHESTQKGMQSLQSQPADPNAWRAPEIVIEGVCQVLGAIECDPCALAEGDSLAEIEYTKKEDGLADANPWPGTVWVNPGHACDCTPWCIKALTELDSGNLSEAILCLPESMLNLVPQLLRFPIAVSLSPLTVTVTNGRKTMQKALPTRSLFIYVTNAPKTELFASAFRDIGVVFARVPWESQTSRLNLP